MCHFRFTTFANGFTSASVQAALACATLLGVAIAEVGISIQHDANHGAYCKCVAPPSAYFLAEIPLGSPRKLFIFTVEKYIYRIKVSKNKIN